MITLATSSNAVLIYTKLVDIELPFIVDVELTNQEKGKTINTAAFVEPNSHFYLLTIFEDISSMTGQNVFTVLVDGEPCYKESALIK